MLHVAANHNISLDSIDLGEAGRKSDDLGTQTGVQYVMGFAGFCKKVPMVKYLCRNWCVLGI